MDERVTCFEAAAEGLVGGSQRRYGFGAHRRNCIWIQAAVTQQIHPKKKRFFDPEESSLWSLIGYRR